MRLLDTYALAAGAKIDKPFIFDQFFPLVYDKYVTFQAQTKFESKDYSYWQDVINILFPVLEKHGYKIIQVGGPNELIYQYVVDLRGKTDLNQLAYVIKNASLHLGSDSVGVHMASAYDVPIVGLYSVSQSTVSGPHFGTKEKQIIFDAYLRTRTGKPSYSNQEQPKCVDLIKPEEVADAAFKLLGLPAKTPFETVFTGNRYGPKIIREFIPVKAFQVSNPEVPIEVRMDLHFDERVLEEQLNFCRALIVTNKRINRELLKKYRQNIAGLIYVVEEEGDDPKFITEIRDLAITIILISYLSDEQLQSKKIDYYEHGKINIVPPEQPEKWDDLKKNMNSLYFKSNKVVAQDGKLFCGNVSRIQGDVLENDFDYYKAVDIPEFWRELPFMTVVKMNDNSA